MCENRLVAGKLAALDEFIDGLSDTDRRGGLISILHRAQQLFGYLPQEVQLHISRKMGLPVAKVNGVVTFYSYFTEDPKGRNVISVCMGTACFVRGAEAVLTELEGQLGIKAGQTTPDMEFSIDALRCVGACGLAPVVMVNGKVYGKVEAPGIKGILSDIREAEARA